MSPYFCLVVSTSAHHGKSDKTVEEIRALVPDMEEAVVIYDKDLRSSGEYFIFVRCPSIEDQKDAVTKVSGIIRVESCGNVPYRFTKKEVDAFVGSIEKKHSDRIFSKGDVVLVRDGMYKNLFGLVTGRRGRRASVLFRFHVRSRNVMLEMRTLEFVKSVFDDKPVNADRSDWFNKFIGNGV